MAHELCHDMGCYLVGSGKHRYKRYEYEGCWAAGLP